MISASLDASWADAERLISTRLPAQYDAAVTLLRDLQKGRRPWPRHAVRAADGVPRPCRKVRRRSAGAGRTAAHLGLRGGPAALFRLLRLTPTEAAPPGPAQAGYFEAPPGPVHAGSAPEAKVAFFGALSAARTDIYAVRHENRRAGRAGWVPAVRGGWRKGVPHAERDHLPLTAEVPGGAPIREDAHRAVPAA